MGVDLQYGECLSGRGEGLQHGDRHGIVTADQDRHRTLAGNGSDSVFDDGPVLSEILLVKRKVAAIDGSSGAGRKNRPAEIKIVPVDIGSQRGCGFSERIRRIAAIGADTAIGRCSGRADKDRRGLDPVQIIAFFHAEEC